MIKLGSKIQCKVIGMEGIATSYNVNKNGCVRVHLQPEVGKDGKAIEGEWIDIQDVKVLISELEGKDIMCIPGTETIEEIAEDLQNPGGPDLPVPTPLPTPM